MEEKLILNKFTALGTYWYIKTEDAISTVLCSEISNELCNKINEFEELYSRFKNSSLISELNKNKVLSNPIEELLEMLNLSLEFNEISKNYFNIASGGELEKLGYTGDFAFSKKGNREKLPLLKKIISFDQNKIYLDSNYNIDLGGIGKSYLIKKLSQILSDTYNLKKFLINAGGDLYTSYPQDVYIQNPVNLNKYLKKISVSKAGVATSSPILRSWITNGQRHHHLINPNKNDTDVNYLSCTVVSEDIIQSDIWSKIILISNAFIEIPLDNLKVYLVNADFEVIELS